MTRPALLFFISCLLASAAQSEQSSGDSQAWTDYRSRTIYFLLADRFHAHDPYQPYVDPEYPTATNPVNCFVIDCTEEQQWRSYWGGDIQGIIQKVDYLQHLGVSAIWITPMMENVRDYGPGIGYGTGYHGYWVQNYYRVNAHFGSWDDVGQLSDLLHANGIRYMQDITLNHSNPLDTHVYGRLFESSYSDQVFIDSYTDDYDPATGLRYYKHYNDDPRCQQVVKDYQEIVPDSQWSYWQLHHCLLADLSGYDQRNPTVANYLLGAGKEWIKNGVDDFRLDAIKFVFPEFVSKYTSTVTNYSRSLGKPAPYIVGEWSNGGVGDAKSLAFANRYNVFGTNILDFQLSFALNRFIGGDYEVEDSQGASQKLSGYELDNFLHERVISFNGRDTWQGTFIDNHDQMRTLVRLQKLGVNSETEREQRMDLATVLLMTVRGIPIIYYGDEQYLAYYNDNDNTKDVNSSDDDPYNRPGMKTWDESTPAFKTIQILAGLRRANTAISRGSYRTVYVDNDILIYERLDGSNMVLVAVNRGTEKTLSLPGFIGFRPGEYSGLLRDASAANSSNYLSISKHSWTVHLGPLSSLVVPRATPAQ